MTRKRQVITIGASTTGETLKDALAGLGDKKRKIHSIRWTGAFSSGAAYSGLFHNTRIRALKDQEEIVDSAMGSFEIGTYSTTYWAHNIKPLLIDLDLDRGEGFKVGLYNASATPLGDVEIEYTDME